MTDKDFMIESQIRVPDGSAISEKPKYLVFFTANDKVKDKRFIATELPDMQASNAKLRGIYVTGSEEELFQNFRTLLQDASKEQYQEVYVPWHAISKIRSLMFKAK
jgi:hypothetical protein